MAVATRHSEGDYSNKYIRYPIFFCSLPYSSCCRLLLLLIYIFLLFLLCPLTSHSSFSFSSAPSPCSSRSHSYSVSPVTLYLYQVTNCRIVSSEAQTTKRFCSVGLQLKFCMDIMFPPSIQHAHFKKFKNLGFFIPYPTAFPYGNGMVLHFYQQQESSTTKTVHKVINKGLKTYV